MENVVLNAIVVVSCAYVTQSAGCCLEAMHKALACVARRVLDYLLCRSSVVDLFFKPKLKGPRSKCQARNTTQARKPSTRPLGQVRVLLYCHTTPLVLAERDAFGEFAARLRSRTLFRNSRFVECSATGSMYFSAGFSASALSELRWTWLSCMVSFQNRSEP